MSKGSATLMIIVFFLVFIIIIGGVIGFFYKEDIKTKFNEWFKKNPSKLPSATLVIGSIDGTTQERIECGYVVGYGDDLKGTWIEVSRGQLQKEALISVEFPLNHTPRVFTNCPEEYYTLKTPAPTVFIPSTYKILATTYKLGNLTLSTQDTLHEEKNNVNISVKAENGRYKNPNICIKHSLGIFDITTNKDRTEIIPKPQRFENYQKCMDLSFESLVKNMQRELIVSYTGQNLNCDDYLTITFFDSDNTIGVIGERFEYPDGSDITADDYSITIKKSC